MKKIYPIRCFTCGKVLKNQLYEKLIISKDKKLFFIENRILRICCKKILLTSKGINIFN